MIFCATELPQEEKKLIMSDTIKFVLEEKQLPTSWYNIVADLPEQPAAVLHPGTGQPVTPDDLSPLFPMAIIAHT